MAAESQDDIYLQLHVRTITLHTLAAHFVCCFLSRIKNGEERPQKTANLVVESQ